MLSMKNEMTRLSATLVVRGALMLALGLAAVVRPEEVLIIAMIGVSIVAVLSGLYEITIAIAMRRTTPRWWMLLLHSLAIFTFGMLTVGAPGLSLRIGLVVTSAWLMFYAVMAWRAATLTRLVRTVRFALTVWGALNVVLALLAIFFREATIFALLFFGALYAALFGAWQIAAGLWIRNELHGRRHRTTAHVGAIHL